MTEADTIVRNHWDWISSSLPKLKVSEDYFRQWAFSYLDDHEWQLFKEGQLSPTDTKKTVLNNLMVYLEETEFSSYPLTRQQTFFAAAVKLDFSPSMGVVFSAIPDDLPGRAKLLNNLSVSICNKHPGYLASKENRVKNLQPLDTNPVAPIVRRMLYVAIEEALGKIPPFPDFQYETSKAVTVEVDAGLVLNPFEIANGFNEFCGNKSLAMERMASELPHWGFTVNKAAGMLRRARRGVAVRDLTPERLQDLVDVMETWTDDQLQPYVSNYSAGTRIANLKKKVDSESNVTQEAVVLGNPVSTPNLSILETIAQFNSTLLDTLPDGTTRGQIWGLINTAKQFWLSVEQEMIQSDKLKESQKICPGCGLAMAADLLDKHVVNAHLGDAVQLFLAQKGGD